MSDIGKIPKQKTLYQYGFLAFFIIISALLFGCSNPAKNDSPLISDLVAPDSMQKGWPDSALAFVKVSDPQGLDDIASVFYTTTKPDGTPGGQGREFPLHDDGLDHDSIAGDGIYSVAIAAPFLIAQTGNYTFSFAARDSKNAKSNTLDKIIAAYEWPYPVISHVTVNQYDLARQHLYVSARVLDIPNQSNIDTVWAEITYQDSSHFIGSFLLNDDGAYGDSVGGDAYYSADILSPDDVYLPGWYMVIFKAVDLDGVQATPVDRRVFVEN